MPVSMQRDIVHHIGKVTEKLYSVALISYGNVRLMIDHSEGVRLQ